MSMYSTRLLAMFTEDMACDYDFKNNRLSNYVFSTMKRYHLALAILNEVDHFDPSILNSQLDLSTRQLNTCLSEMIAEGWVENCKDHSYLNGNGTRQKYKCIRAAKPLRDFWEDFSIYWLKLSDKHQLSIK